MDNLEARGQDPQATPIRGIAPSLNIDPYRGTHIPKEWNITGVLGNIIQAEYVDCDEKNEYIDRGGIFIDNKVSQYVWRVAKVIHIGPGVRDLAVGDHIMFPNDKGITMTNVNGHSYIFLDESRIFAKVEANK